MSDIIFGNDAILQVNIDGVYVAVGCAMSCSFEYQNELIGKTDVNAGLSRKKRVRMGDSKMSVHGLTTLIDDATAYSPMYFLQEAVRRTEQDLRLLLIDEGNIIKQIQGSYLVSRINVTGAATDFSEFDIDFEGTGTISLADADESGATLINGDVQFDWWEMGAGDTSVTGPGHFGRSFAGEDIILVVQEGIQYNETAGTPGAREYANSGTVISFVSDTPAVGGERVYVMWKNV